MDDRLTYGLKIKEEAQLLNGDGVGENLLGLTLQATPFASPIVITDPTPIDTLAAALAQVRIANMEPDGIIVNPQDWLGMQTMKDVNGRYILGDPAVAAPQQILSKPVVVTASIEPGTFLVGAFKQSAILWDRLAVAIYVATVNDDFIRNKITILCEERIGLSVVSPLGLVGGDFPTVTP